MQRSHLGLLVLTLLAVSSGRPCTVDIDDRRWTLDVMNPMSWTGVPAVDQQSAKLNPYPDLKEKVSRCCVMIDIGHRSVIYHDADVAI